jgi:2-amino-4-hydroxy-6-hydroxymethyldihydropteridine diphosphokinase
MRRAYIGLGSNVGDRLTHLQRAVHQLRETTGIEVARLSSVYEAEPVGVTDQGWFLNAVVQIGTTLSPYALLEHAQTIERALHKRITRRWGPRTIDLDILLYADWQIKTATLEIPHPELRKRAFVLIPLLELDPFLVLPDGSPLSHALPPLLGQQRVHRVAAAELLA